MDALVLFYTQLFIVKNVIPLRATSDDANDSPTSNFFTAKGGYIRLMNKFLLSEYAVNSGNL